MDTKHGNHRIIIVLGTHKEAYAPHLPKLKTQWQDLEGIDNKKAHPVTLSIEKEKMRTVVVLEKEKKNMNLPINWCPI